MRRAAHASIALLFGLSLTACVDERQPPTSPALPGDPSSVIVPDTPTGQPGDPLPGLTTAQALAFTRGKAVFQRVFTQATGLGPIFNSNSCAECHEDPTTGGAGDEDETHFTRLHPSGVCSELAAIGGFVHQAAATPKLTNKTGLLFEPFPSSVPFQTGTRSTPDLFAFGLFSAIPEAALLALADPNDANGDGISGRAHVTGTGAIGRFGRKAAGASLSGFNAGAFLAEMGITNPFAPEESNIGDVFPSDSIPAGVDPVPGLELSGEDLDDLNAFVMFLAPPPRPLVDQGEGRLLFKNIGCAKCHTPEFTTGNVGVAALSNQTVRPFSDFLLHDMGPQQDICLGAAGATEFRTEPLMGARLMTRFMHDGASPDIRSAILRHGGEGEDARDAFANDLSNAERNAVISYIQSL